MSREYLKKLIMAALFAALACVATMIIKVPTHRAATVAMSIINFFKYSLDIIISPLFINKFLFPSYIAFDYEKRINFRQKYKTRLSKETENTNILLPDPV